MLVESSGTVSTNSNPLNNSTMSPKSGIIVKPVNTSPLPAKAKAGKSPISKPPMAMDVQAKLANTPPHVLIRSISSLSHASIRPRTPDNEEGTVSGVPPVRKGILMQARDRLFSRWKERYFVLTRDYLACFRKGSTKYSEMGSFIFKVNLATVDYVGWEDRRGAPVLSIALPREGKMLLRAKVGLDQWYRDLRETTCASKNRRNALKRGSSTTHINQIGTEIQQSPIHRKLGGSHFNLSDSTPEIVQLCESVCHNSSPAPVRNVSRQNRFSLMTNIETGSCEGDLGTPPSSVTSSHKFSSSTSSTSGSGGSSSLASSPSLRNGGVWPRPPSPMRHISETGPRTRYSLYEGPREPVPETAKSRHSVCVEPRGLHSDIISVFRKRSSNVTSNNRHSICTEPRDYRNTTFGSRTSLVMQPRNPILELLESTSKSTGGKEMKSKGQSSPARSEPDTVSSRPMPVPNRDGVDTSPSPPPQHRPRCQSASIASKAFGPRSRTNLAVLRNSALFN